MKYVVFFEPDELNTLLLLTRCPDYYIMIHSISTEGKEVARDCIILSRAPQYLHYPYHS